MSTVALNPTQNASKSEYYAEEDETCNTCTAEKPMLVGINAKHGNRKLTYLCEDCLAEIEDAPAGLYDPVVIAEWDA